MLDKETNGNALLNIKHVHILATIRGFLPSPGIAMKIQQVEIIKGLHEAAAHTTERGVIKIAMVGDKR